MVTASAIKLSINDKEVRTFHHNGTAFTDLDLRCLTKKEKNKFHILYLCSEMFFIFFSSGLRLSLKIIWASGLKCSWDSFPLIRINLSSLRFVMTLEEKIRTNTQLQEQQCLTEDVQMWEAAFRWRSWKGQRAMEHQVFFVSSAE